MNNDIVTRPEQEIDFVEYLRLWASPDGDDQAVRDLHKAADEIERLQTENAFLKKALVRYGCEYVDIISAVTEWGENE